MRLDYLKIRNFRNLASVELETAPVTTVLVGSNGAGKTNTLEAAHYSLCGRSFRTRRALDMVMEGEGFLRLESQGQLNGARFERRASLAAEGTEKRGSDIAKEPLPVVCFTPDDLSLVKGAPAQRRSYIDRAIARKHPRHGRTVADFQKALSQRNRFLERARAGLVGLSEISPWDGQVAALSAKVYRERQRFCRDLREPFRRAYRDISGHGLQAAVELTSQLAAFKQDDIEGELLGRLKKRWQTDMGNGTTGIGAHRDDIDFCVNGSSVRTRGSQGEQRLTVLALLLAETDAAAASGGEKPLVMLDDVMSELDPERRQLLINRLEAAGQVIITAADRGSMPVCEGEGRALHEVSNGQINRAGVAINV